ncbi:MAG: DNA methyltransferase [Cytophagia bacterium]|nr:MAG: DNA methyltransferase [Cytophagia bacterium]TAG39225.1 MAG: DNA methyltransferase [Cytophagia bacterium]
MTEKEILAETYNVAENLDFDTVSNLIKNDIDVLIDKIDSNKSLVSALVTSLVKKIYEPKQDIRLHRTDFENGYSARVLDTQVTSPFFKDNFPKYANKESSFLTLATRERIKWTKDEGDNLKIRDKKLKACFLNIFEQVEALNANPKDYLNYIFAKLIALSKIEKALFESTNLQTENLETLNIHLIIKMLQEHFDTKQSSRLPVVAIYAIYEILLPKFERYKNKKLVILQVHTSSDKHGFGDIEIYTTDNQPFEIVEIKHNIPIDKYLIFDIAKKTQNIKIDRYYILTTFANGFASAESEKEVTEYILELKKTQGIDIIANGIITTLKYYLRFIDNYQEFIDVYTQNLIKDAKNSTEIKNFHLEKWTEILKKYSYFCDK